MTLWTRLGLEPAHDVAAWLPDPRAESPREQIERIRDYVNDLTTLVDHLHHRPALYSHDVGGVAIDLIVLLHELGSAFGYDLLGELEEERASAGGNGGHAAH
jgi:hypothetical protein